MFVDKKDRKDEWKEKEDKIKKFRIRGSNPARQGENLVS